MLKKVVLIAIGAIIASGFIHFLHQTKAQSSPPSISGRFYRFDVVAETGQFNLSASDRSSINNSGVIAFVGKANSSSEIEQIFTRKISGQLATVTSVNPNASSVGFSSITLNDANKIGAMLNAGLTTGNYVHEIRLWDANSVDSSVLIANARGYNGQGPTFDWEGFIQTSSLNNNDQTAFTVQPDANSRLVTGIRPNFNSIIHGGVSFGVSPRPAIDDNGNTVAGDLSTGLRLYPYNLTTPTNIEGPSTFSELGGFPGIAENGGIIAFYGNKATGADAGPGIFLSIPQGTGRVTIKVAGGIKYEKAPSPGQIWGNGTGGCDANDPCVGELGLDRSNNPLFLQSFHSDSRIGIIHQSLGATGLADDVLVLCYLATPNNADDNPTGTFSNQLGVWTQRISFKRIGNAISIDWVQARPIPVVQVGDSLDGITITNFPVLSDPIAKVAFDGQGNARQEKPGDHQITFMALTSQTGNSAPIIYRATQTDTDEDGLYDHWETTGIDFNNDRNIDLPIHQPCEPNSPPVTACGANPNRKDLFVEIDYMQSSNWSHRPDYKPTPVGSVNSVSALDQVRQAFTNAPVSNPVGGNGITLHTGADDALTEAETITLAGRRPGSNDDFYDYKFGNSTNICVDGRFGTATERNNTDGNCLNRLKAKSLAFRYAIFANSFFDNTPLRPGNSQLHEPGDSGVAEPFGNDFLITLGRKISSGPSRKYDFKKVADGLKNQFSTSFDTEWASMQAGTFMHELGHSLGLFHGGNDGLNCKPNYVSIMNYSRQVDMGGLADGFPLTSGVHNGQWIRVNRKVDFSSASLPVLPTSPNLNGRLDETALDERVGVAGQAGQRIVFAKATPTPTPNPSPTTTPSPTPTPTPAPFVGPADGQIDWNGLGINSSPVIADVNYLPTHCGNNIPPSPGQVLSGFNDWGNLVFNHRQIYFSSNGINESLLSWNEPEPSSQQFLDGGLGGPDVDNDSIPNIDDNCVFAPNTNQADSNGDGVGNLCDFATTALADLSLDMTAPITGVNLNSPFDYQITVSNQGLNSTGGVKVTDQLPAQVNYVSATPSQGSCSGSSNLICNLGTIASGSSVTITVRVTPTVRGRVTNTAEVSIDAGQSTVTDPNIANNNDGASVDVVDSSTTYMISGRVTDVNSIGVAGAFVHYSGESSGTAVTDSNGNYFFSAVSGGTYTLKPYKFARGFAPPSRTILNLASNEVVNFVGAPVAETAKVSDFDGDGKSDISVFRQSDHTWYLQQSTAGYFNIEFGVVGDLIAPADYDGDGKTDVAMFRPSTGTWYTFNSQSQSFTTTGWGASGDLPVPADHDGDGRADLVVFRPSTNTWYTRFANGTFASTVFGVTGDKPVVGDFDGDGKADIALYRPSDNNWYILKTGFGFFIQTWGVAGDIPVPADYDGDGATDVAVFRPSTGQWFRIQSTAGFDVVNWGASGDMPIPADYDGDGKSDVAVFRPSNATWYIVGSMAGIIQNSFGQNGDLPTESAFIY